MRRSILIALALLMVYAPTTSAKSINWLPIFVKAGITEWGAPDCGKVTFAWAYLDAQYGYDVQANNNPATCVITWDLESWPDIYDDPGTMCLVTLHEMGHLDGEDDDPDDPSDIMYGTEAPNAPWSTLDWQDYAPCNQSIRVVWYVAHGDGSRRGHRRVLTSALRPRTP